MFTHNNVLIRFWLFSQQKNYSEAWDKIKAKSYQIPHDSHALQHAKLQKVILSNVSSVNCIPCYYYAEIFFTLRDNMNVLSPLGEVQGGL